MTEVENLGGVGDKLLDQTPDPAGAIGQPADCGRLLTVGLVIDLRHDRPKRFTVRDLRLEHLGQQFVPRLAPLCYIVGRERQHDLGFALALVFWALPFLPRRTQGPIHLQIQLVLLPARQRVVVATGLQGLGFA